MINKLSAIYMASMAIGAGLITGACIMISLSSLISELTNYLFA